MPTKNSLFVDTSGWVCIVDQDDPLHRQARTLYKRAISQKRQLVTTNYIIAELVALLESRNLVTRQEIFAFVDHIKLAPTISIVHVDTNTDDEAWQLLKNRADKAWSLVDATSFVIMQRMQLPEALTTDHHFTQAGFIRLPAQR
jgi:predicted nucleic acid-binding protein